MDKGGFPLFKFTKRMRRSIRRGLLMSMAIGSIAGLLVRGPGTAPWQGLLFGALVGLLTPVLIIVVRELVWHSRLVELRFGLFALVNLMVNALAIVVGFQLAALSFGLGWVSNPRFFLVGALITIGFTAWFTVDRFLGAGVLSSLLTGRYHHPRYEDRIFLFADLADSTPLAQKLGDLSYHRFLNAVFTAIGPTIDRFEGAVHRYIGDEMIVTWPYSVGVDDATCVLCALEILDVLEKAGPSFIEEFGEAPHLRIALHGGEVVAGEISGQKREIVYSGDAINTTARIQGIASSTDQSLVISSELMSKLDLPLDVIVESLGEFQLKGRNDVSELLALF
jgi:adenylate cyclase